MAAIISRRLRLSTLTSSLLKPSSYSVTHFISNNPKPPIFKPSQFVPLPPIRFLSTNNKGSSSTSDPEETQKPSPSPYPSQNPNFKHQEIESPTVERDIFQRANELRVDLETMMKKTYSMSRLVATLGLLQLPLCLLVTYLTKTEPIISFKVSVLSLLAFAFPFVLLRALKPMPFFKKMEELMLVFHFHKHRNGGVSVKIGMFGFFLLISYNFLFAFIFAATSLQYLLQYMLHLETMFPTKSN